MRRLVAMMAILGVTLTACAGGTDDAGPDDATTTTTTLGTTTTTTLATSPSTTRAGKPTTTTRAGKPTATAPVTLRCKTVGFTPSSEDAASDIRATGLSCREAESFVRVAGTRTSAGGPQELDVSGYHCVRTRSEEEFLPRAYYQCVNGRKKVTFVRS